MLTLRPMKRTWPVAILLGAALGGCSFAGDATTDTAGIGAGAIVGAVTANPFIGIGVGIAARWAAGAVVDAAERRIHDSIQTRIAETAGDAPEGEWRSWSIDFDLPGADQAGRVMVLRAHAAEPPCRDIVYTDDPGEDADFFVAVVCRSASGWKWAVSEPATHRWGSLQ